MHQERARAFTFIEVIAALAIVSIALLGLLRLHLFSISMADKAERTAQALLLAQEKIAEILAHGYPEQGTTSSTAEIDNITMHWQTHVTDLSMPSLGETQTRGMRKILASVTWQDGANQKNLQLSTYVADRRLP
ncbi:MAG: type II secretion system protein [Phycisphaerales bacterium]|nr:MAG: type II secretion system protein [Phycisphaerales bacterium]